jgi:abequosyltransferase
VTDTTPRPLISVIVSCYNRASELAPLLDSVIAQDRDDWEVVITEDLSPERAAIGAAAAPYVARFPDRIRYLENPENLGYDRAHRRLIELARGRYVFLMGNDDLVAPGAFSAIADAVERHGEIGMFLRAYTVFRGDPSNVVQENRFYPGEVRFPAGPKAFLAVYRRLVAMSGIVFHRDLAHSVASDAWDGTLFYQHWVAGNLLAQRDAVYLPQILAYFRSGGTPSVFGTAEAERGRFTPGVQPPDTDLRMVGAIMAIAEAVDTRYGLGVMDDVRADFARYIYPTIAHQAHQPWPVFWRFYRDLGGMGFDRSPWFHFWFWSTVAFGEQRLTRWLRWVRRRVGHTPNLTRAVRAG